MYINQIINDDKPKKTIRNNEENSNENLLKDSQHYFVIGIKVEE